MANPDRQPQPPLHLTIIITYVQKHTHTMCIANVRSTFAFGLRVQNSSRNKDDTMTGTRRTRSEWLSPSSSMIIITIIMMVSVYVFGERRVPAISACKRQNDPAYG